MSPELKNQLKAGFFKVLPAVSTLLVYRGIVTQEQGAALVTGAQAAIDYGILVAGIAGNVWTAVYTIWANRSSKKLADAVELGAKVKVPDPVLAAKVDAITPASAPSVAIAP